MEKEQEGRRVEGKLLFQYGSCSVIGGREEEEGREEGKIQTFVSI